MADLTINLQEMQQERQRLMVQPPPTTAGSGVPTQRTDFEREVLAVGSLEQLDALVSVWMLVPVWLDG